jgi:hypothetical protein
MQPKKTARTQSFLPVPAYIANSARGIRRGFSVKSSTTPCEIVAVRAQQLLLARDTYIIMPVMQRKGESQSYEKPEAIFSAVFSVTDTKIEVLSLIQSAYDFPYLGPSHCKLTGCSSCLK